MCAEDGLDGVEGFAGDGGDGGVVEGEDGDGLATVDLVRELGFGKVLIEQAQFWVLAQHFCDVEGLDGPRHSY